MTLGWFNSWYLISVRSQFKVFCCIIYHRLQILKMSWTVCLMINSMEKDLPVAMDLHLHYTCFINRSHFICWKCCWLICTVISVLESNVSNLVMKVPQRFAWIILMLWYCHIGYTIACHLCLKCNIFLTQCQFGILWIVNVLPLVLTGHSWIILEVKMYLVFAITFTLAGCTFD